MIIDCVLAFFGGALYEASCVAWVHYSETGDAFRAALVSMLVAACTVVGVVESIRNIIAAPFFIFGYGIGTYIAVSFKNRKKI
jgi:hypothetical protein